MRRIYTEYCCYAPPYTLVGTSTPDNANALFQSAVGTILLDHTSNVDVSIVASKLEKTFDMTSLFAFSRSPSSSKLEYTYTTRQAIYVYNSRVLYILFIPAFAAILGYWCRWWMGGREVVGYDVVEHANMEPVRKLEGGVEGSEKVKRRKVVWCEGGVGKLVRGGG